MRPRHKAAENDDRPERMDRPVQASMRPRHKAAENVTVRARYASLVLSLQ